MGRTSLTITMGLILVGSLCSGVACSDRVDSYHEWDVGAAGGDVHRAGKVDIDVQPHARRLTVGFAHTCAVDSSGKVWCWGIDNFGKLGNGRGNGTFRMSTPVRVEGLESVVDISAGEDHTCAIRTDGKVYCWGLNSQGQLGPGSRDPIVGHAPVEVEKMDTAVDVSTGGDHTCALTKTGGVFCWGSNEYGQSGNHRTDDGALRSRVPTPKRVRGIRPAVAISSGYDHTCAKDHSGSVLCWGNNRFGQLGNGVSGEDRKSGRPVEADYVHAPAEIEAGGGHTCVIRSDGGTACWGSSRYGELGNGTSGPDAKSFRPADVPGIGRGSTLSAGTTRTCVVTNGGSIYCWGKSFHGALGNGESGTSDSLSAVPVRVKRIEAADTVATDSSDQGHSCARLKTGEILCWGNNGNGQLGSDSGGWNYSAVPIPVEFPR